MTLRWCSGGRQTEAKVGLGATTFLAQVFARSSDRSLVTSGPCVGQTFPLPVTCPACGGLLTALVGLVDPASDVIDWRCSYCQTTHRNDLGGKLVWIVKRSGGHEQILNTGQCSFAAPTES